MVGLPIHTVIVNALLLLLAILLWTGILERNGLTISLRSKIVTSLLGLFVCCSYLMAEIYYSGKESSLLIIITASLTVVSFVGFFFKIAKDKKAIEEADQYFDYKGDANFMDSFIYFFITISMVLTGAVKMEGDKIYSWKKIVPVVFYISIIVFLLLLMQKYLHLINVPILNK